MQKNITKRKKISLIGQQIEYMKNINNNINAQNNIYDNNSKYIYKKMKMIIEITEEKFLMRKKQ